MRPPRLAPKTGARTWGTRQLLTCSLPGTLKQPFVPGAQLFAATDFGVGPFHRWPLRAVAHIRLIDRTSMNRTTMATARPIHSWSAMAHPHNTSTTSTPPLCHSMAKSGFRFERECLPARNHNKDATMPPIIQCCDANCDHPFGIDYSSRPRCHGTCGTGAWCPRFASALCELTWGGTTRVVRLTRNFPPDGAPKSRRRGNERVTQGRT